MLLRTTARAHILSFLRPSPPTQRNLDKPFLALCFVSVPRRAITSPRRVPGPSVLVAGWALSASLRPCRDLPTTLLGERPRRIALNYTQQIRNRRKFDPEKNKNYSAVKNVLEILPQVWGESFGNLLLSLRLAVPPPASLTSRFTFLFGEGGTPRVGEKTHPAPAPPPFPRTHFAWPYLTLLPPSRQPPPRSTIYLIFHLPQSSLTCLILI